MYKRLINYNYSKGRNGEKIKYIVIHDTGNTSLKSDALAHYNYFNNGVRNASAHYFVDDKRIVQCVLDENTSWHCGDGKGKFGINNYNSIGIEICVNKDGDYDKSIQNCIELVVELMKKHSIEYYNHLVRHYDASRKICPHSMSDNNWVKWWDFKQKVFDIIQENKKESFLYRVIAGTYKNKKNAENQVKKLIESGIDCYIEKK